MGGYQIKSPTTSNGTSISSAASCGVFDPHDIRQIPAQAQRLAHRLRK